jgi:dihydrofolate reductase
MRRIVMFNRVSADGYFATPDGGIDWPIPEPALDAQVASNLHGEGAILLGRRTYDMFEAFWPHALDDPKTAKDPHADRRSEELRAMAVWINAATKIVVSRSRTEVTWRNSRILRELEPRAVEALKREPGPDLMIFGSSSIVTQLTAHGLIDEYQLVVSPIVLGRGRPWLDGADARRRLELVEAQPFPHGNVKLRYRRGD